MSILWIPTWKTFSKPFGLTTYSQIMVMSSQAFANIFIFLTKFVRTRLTNKFLSKENSVGEPKSFNWTSIGLRVHACIQPQKFDPGVMIIDVHNLLAQKMVEILISWNINNCITFAYRGLCKMYKSCEERIRSYRLVIYEIEIASFKLLP